MSNNRIILILKASDIDIFSLPEDKRDTKSRAFKDAVYSHPLKNYGVSGENILLQIQNDIITIDGRPRMPSQKGVCVIKPMNGRVIPVEGRD